MSPLSVEVYNPEARRWVQVGNEINPDDPAGSMSNNTPNGGRELYFFGCAPNDSQSTIYRSGAGADTEVGKLRVSAIDLTKLEVIRELRKGESFEMEIKTDQSPAPRKIRFTHR